MITLPTDHPYFFTCPSCGCKLISVSSGVKAKPHCPECDYSADDAFVVKDRIMVDDSFYDDVLDAFEEYDIEYEEV
jgi:transcription elongation factor Elf1